MPDSPAKKPAEGKANSKLMQLASSPGLSAKIDM